MCDPFYWECCLFILWKGFCKSTDTVSLAVLVLTSDEPPGSDLPWLCAKLPPGRGNETYQMVFLAESHSPSWFGIKLPILSEDCVLVIFVMMAMMIGVNTMQQWSEDLHSASDVFSPLSSASAKNCTLCSLSWPSSPLPMPSSSSSPSPLSL